MNFRVKMDGCTKQTPFILAQNGSCRLPTAGVRWRRMVWADGAGEKTVESRGREVTLDGYETITFIL